MTTADPNAIVREFVEEAVNAHDVDAIDAFATPDITIRGTTEHDDREAFKTYLRGVFGAFPDVTFSLERLVAAGDTVAFRAVVTGTHEGEFQGIPATGNQFEYTASFFAELEDGRMAELAYDADRVALMEDLGVMD